MRAAGHGWKGAMGWRAARRLALAGAVAAGLGGHAGAADPPQKLPGAVAAAPKDDTRVAAYIYGNVPVTRQEFGEFLIARGGMDKLELLVNKRIIDTEAAGAKVAVTAEEVTAALMELIPAGMPGSEFAQVVQKRYGTTLYEWTEDVLRPRLILGKLARKQVAFTDDEVRKAFDNQYGEKREARVIVWPKDAKVTPEEFAAVRANDAAFDKAAREQPDKGLAESEGRIKPAGRYLTAEDPLAIETLFRLKEGETSEIFTTKDGQRMCIRCTRVAPADPNVTLDKVRASVEKDVIEQKLAAIIPGLFAGIQKKAAPDLLGNAPQPKSEGVVQPGTAPPPASRDPNALAYIYGDRPVTREELGEFLIARGGADKLDRLVNHRVIEVEARKRGVAVTDAEVDAAYGRMIQSMGIVRKDFEEIVLPKQKLTRHEYLEDVVKPDLTLGKMVAGQVAVTEEDVKKAFEARFGEKRDCKMIVWPKGQEKVALQQWDQIRKEEAAGDAAAFDRIARAQSDPRLASAAGRMAPVGRYLDAENPVIEDLAFSLKPGEMSQLVETKAGVICLKCVGTVPPQPGITLDMVRAELEAAVRERKTAKAMPVLFATLREAAKPQLLISGSPSVREFEEGVRQLTTEAIRRAGGPGR